jgi:hypothetical protein
LIPHYWPPTGTVQVLWDPRKTSSTLVSISQRVDTTVLVRTGTSEDVPGRKFCIARSEK